MKTSTHFQAMGHLFNWYPRTMVRDTDGPKFGVKKLKSNEISCFLSPSYLNLLNMHTFTLKYNYLNFFKLPHIYVHFYIFFIRFHVILEI